ncbi:hypothetical protein Ancab_007380 [Ancistrocladus abbreviatus]
MANPSSRPPPPPNPLDLDITIISAKHLKNVNWRNGDLNPYATFWLHPDQRFSTKPSVSPSTKPVWNEHFTVPLPSSLHDSLLTLEIFHSKPSDTPKPLVGTARIKLSELLPPNSIDCASIHTLQLVRPSGRPHGKILVKIALRERPPPPPPSLSPYKDYNFPPQSGYYSSAPPPPPPPTFNLPDYNREYFPSPYAAPHPPPPHLHPPVTAVSYSYGAGYSSDGYSGYNNYSNYHPRQMLPAQLPRAFPGYGSSASSGPSAPVDYSYDQRFNAGGIGPVMGALGGLSLEERVAKCEEEEEKNGGERLESDAAAGTGREKFSDYHGKY